MLYLLLLFGFPLILIESQAYVLLQVRKKDANHSAVDALVHKTVSSDKFDKFAEKMGQWKNRDEDKSREHFRSEDALTPNVTFILDASAYKPDKAFKEETNKQTGRLKNRNSRGKEKEPELKDILNMIGRRFFKGSAESRSTSEQYGFQPKTVRLNNGVSSVYKVHPDSLIFALQDLLSSVALRKYVDKLGRKTAVVYRTVEEDMKSYLLRWFLS